MYQYLNFIYLFSFWMKSKVYIKISNILFSNKLLFIWEAVRPEKKLNVEILMSKHKTMIRAAALEIHLLFCLCCYSISKFCLHYFHQLQEMYQYLNFIYLFSFWMKSKVYIKISNILFSNKLLFIWEAWNTIILMLVTTSL
jgi:hypothetical protein